LLRCEFVTFLTSDIAEMRDANQFGSSCDKELDGPAVSVVPRAIAEVKRHW
jgi:hypothetical protein